ncbi:hypothetical protein K440DRAFT_171606 [Wilcoxina mikolae CBS 423.85]|nr:hypothetical protein K440DRAFT_171606 [Wilcoxina mikolae CBS 423.85]
MANDLGATFYPGRDDYMMPELNIVSPAPQRFVPSLSHFPSPLFNDLLYLLPPPPPPPLFPPFLPSFLSTIPPFHSLFTPYPFVHSFFVSSVCRSSTPC